MAPHCLNGSCRSLGAEFLTTDALLESISAYCVRLSIDGNALAPLSH